MSKKIVLMLSLLTVSNAVAYDFSSHTFFSARPPFQTASPEKIALWHYEFLNKEEQDICGTFEVVPFGGTSLSDGLGRYFGLDGQSILRVQEGGSDLNKTKNIDSTHFNIKTVNGNFESEFCFNPIHRFVGAGFAWRQRIGDRWWGALSFPIYQVENQIEFEETVINNGGGPLAQNGLDGVPFKANVEDLLNGPNWKLGRWSPNEKRSKTGIGDVEVKLGWESYNNGEAHFRSYIGGLFPTGNKPDPTQFFAPVVGNNQHWGVFFGSNMGFELHCWGDHTVRNEIDTMGRYLFPNRQVRAFDVVDKQWGHYQEIYGSQDQAATAAVANDPNAGISGINRFMREVEVRPRFSNT